MWTIPFLHWNGLARTAVVAGKPMSALDTGTVGQQDGKGENRMPPLQGHKNM